MIFFLVSLGLESEISNVKISPSICTDHSLISLTLSLPQTQKRGHGFWKFNNSLLKDSDYICIVKNIISYVKQENPFENKSLLWEYLKCRIRTETMTYSSIKAKHRRAEECLMADKLKYLEECLCSNSDPKINEEYLNLKQRLEDFEFEKTKGTILRSKAKFAEEGEKNSRYFLNLEKRNYNNKHMKSIIGDKNTVITKPQEILSEQVKFFEKLYSSCRASTSEVSQLENNFLENPSIPQLDIDQQHFLDEPITKDEIAKALKEMPNDKSPGLDGFSTNFYKFFWPNINEFVKDSFECARLNGTLSNSQRLGVISLIPKKDKDLRYIKSWRPVTISYRLQNFS